MTTPYTYRVTHTPTGKWYYGVRYARGCHPDDLWISYYTSSREVKELLHLDGQQAFVTEIRRTFHDEKSAIAWELRVLRKILGLERCLNENAFPAVSAEARRKSAVTRATVGADGLTPAQRSGLRWKAKQHDIDPQYGLTLKELRRIRYNESLDRNNTRYLLSKGLPKKGLPGDLNPAKRPEVRAKIKATLDAQVAAGTFQTTKGRKFPSISEKLKGNKAAAGLVWYNDGAKDYRLKPEDERTQILKEGRLFSAIRGKHHAKVVCPKCGKEGSGGNMKRYHFEACRL